MMSGALSTFTSVLERHWLLVEKRSRKETGCNFLSKNVCDVGRAVLYSTASDALVLLLGNYKMVAFV